MQRDLYTRELRLQEDEIYRLEDCLEECHSIIRGMREENHALREQVGSGGAAAGASGDASDPFKDDKEGSERSLLDDSDWSPDRPAPGADVPDDGDSDAEDSLPDIELPAIDGGEPAEAPPFNPAESPLPETLIKDAPLPDAPMPAGPAAAPADEIPTLEIPGGDAPDAQAPGPGPAEPFSPGPLPTQPPASETLPAPTRDPAGAPDEPAEFELLPLGALPIDTPVYPTSALEPAGEGIVSIELSCEPGPPEPNGDATIVATARPLSRGGHVALVQGVAEMMMRFADAPAGEGELGRWRYEPTEVAASWLGMADNPRLAFALVLPSETPRDQPVELWVRFADSGGKKYLARADVRFDGGGQGAATETVEASSDAPAVPQAVEEAIRPRQARWAPRKPEGGEPPRAAASTPNTAPGAGWRGAEASGSEVRLTGHDEAVR